MLENRQKVTITGVQDVDSFDEATVLLATDLGISPFMGWTSYKQVKSEEGQLLVEEIIALQYSDADYSKGKGEGLLSRLFR